MFNRLLKENRQNVEFVGKLHLQQAVLVHKDELSEGVGGEFSIRADSSIGDYFQKALESRNDNLSLRSIKDAIEQQIIHPVYLAESKTHHCPMYMFPKLGKGISIKAHVELIEIYQLRLERAQLHHRQHAEVPNAETRSHIFQPMLEIATYIANNHADYTFLSVIKALRAINLTFIGIHTVFGLTPTTKYTNMMLAERMTGDRTTFSDAFSVPYDVLEDVIALPAFHDMFMQMPEKIRIF